MKVLLVILNYHKGFPFIQDLETNLKRQPDIEVDILDSDRLYIRHHDGSIEHLIGYATLRNVIKIPKLGTIVRLLTLRRYLATLKGAYDAVNVHSCDPIYIYLIKQLQAVSENLYPMIWGSDFYRASEKLLEKKRVIFDRARYIIFANPVNARDFVSYYKCYKEKAIITGFGVAKFDRIEKIKNSESVAHLKQRFALPADKIIVAVGYNGTRGQQHALILEQLKQFTPEKKNRLFILLQMTYGYNSEYAAEIEKMLNDTGIAGRVLNEFLDDDETSRLRLAVDVVLNAQITDGFSASIQEHIYAKNIVIVGDWLPYQPLEHAEIQYLKSAPNEFGSRLSELIDDYEQWKTMVQGNGEKIYEISGWHSKVKNWMSIYKGDGNRFLYREDELFIKN